MLSQLNYSIVANIKQILSLEEACRQYLPGIVLRRRGRKLWACCPFHSEKTPSFLVDTERGRWRCFGCGKYGDALDLAAAGLGVPLAEAVKIVAADLGLSQDTNPARRQAARARIEENCREQAAVRKFEAAVFAAFIQAAAACRAAYKLTTRIKTEADLDRPEVGAAFMAIPFIEDILDGLTAPVPAEQYRGLRRWQRMIAQ